MVGPEEGEEGMEREREDHLTPSPPNLSPPHCHPCSHDPTDREDLVLSLHIRYTVLRELMWQRGMEEG